VTGGSFPLRASASTATVVGLAMTASTMVGMPVMPTRQPDRIDVVGHIHYTARPASSNVQVRGFAAITPKPAVTSREEMAMTRIDAIAALEDGWIGPGTIAPTPALVNWVRAHLTQISAAPVDASIIPIGDGYISLVWDTADREYTAELHADGVTFFVDHLDSDEIEERELPLDWDAIAAEMGSQA